MVSCVDCHDSTKFCVNNFLGSFCIKYCFGHFTNLSSHLEFKALKTDRSRAEVDSCYDGASFKSSDLFRYFRDLSVEVPSTYPARQDLLKIVNGDVIFPTAIPS